jgi:hypothetical protein
MTGRRLPTALDEGLVEHRGLTRSGVGARFAIALVGHGVALTWQSRVGEVRGIHLTE